MDTELSNTVNHTVTQQTPTVINESNFQGESFLVNVNLMLLSIVLQSVQRRPLDLSVRNLI